MMTHIKQLIALGYYDGPTSGLVKIVVDGEERYFTFDLLSWDELQDKRVFGLSELVEQSLFDRIVELAGPPRWPIWVPEWRFGSESIKATAEQVVEQVKRIKPPSRAVMFAPASLDRAAVDEALPHSHRQLLSQFSATGSIQAFEPWRSLYPFHDLELEGEKIDL